MLPKRKYTPLHSFLQMKIDLLVLLKHGIVLKFSALKFKSFIHLLAAAVDRIAEPSPIFKELGETANFVTIYLLISFKMFLLRLK